MNESQRNECRILAAETISRLSTLIKYDFHMDNFSVFESCEEFIFCYLRNSIYALKDIETIVEKNEKKNELDKVI